MKKSLSVCEDKEFFTFPSYFTLLTNKRKDENGNYVKIVADDSFYTEKNREYWRNVFYVNVDKFEESLSTYRLVVKRFIDFLNIYREKRLDAKVHCLGASASLAMHLLNYTGVFKQFDSANWRVKAKYAKLQFGYRDYSVSEAYIGQKDINYGNTEWKDEWDTLLLRCDCPVCKGLSLKQRINTMRIKGTEGFRNRAIHNAYHYYLELQTGRELMGTDKYEKLINKRVKGSSGFYKMFWKAIKHHIKPYQNVKLDSFIKK